MGGGGVEVAGRRGAQSAGRRREEVEVGQCMRKEVAGGAGSTAMMAQTLM